MNLIEVAEKLSEDIYKGRFAIISESTTVDGHETVKLLTASGLVATIEVK